MRLRLNRSLKTKTKKKTEHGALRCTATKKTNKIKHEFDATEPIIQIAFTTSVIMALFISFNMLHVAALIILFKCLTNFPKERNIEEPRVQTLAEHRNLMRQLRGWGRRKRRANWQLARCTAKLTLAMLVTINLTDTIAQLSNPENPKHAFSKLLYSLTHDKLIVNNPGSDIPIRPATMTRNRSRIRKELEDLIKSLNSIIKSGMKSLNNILNVRNDDVRNITKMISKVWTFLLRKMWTLFTRTHTESKKPEEHWSLKNCEECDICVPRGPQPQCPLCNAELIGLVNYLKVNAEVIVTLPSDILKSMAWAPIKHLLINTLDKALAHLIYHGPNTLTGLFISIRKELTRILLNIPSEYRTYDKNDSSQGKEPENRRPKGRKKQRKRNTNLILMAPLS